MLEKSLPPRPVVLAGSRSLYEPAAEFSSWLAAELVRLGFPLSVGCAPGADSDFISGALSVPGGASLLSVFAVGSRGGAGFPIDLMPSSASVPPWVVQASVAGASVHWLAGGPLSFPLRVRLARRTRAAVMSASVAAVLVFGSPFSRGTQLAGQVAVARGLPVFAFAFNFMPARLPSLGAGSWVPARLLSGLACWGWSSSQPALF